MAMYLVEVMNMGVVQYGGAISIAKSGKINSVNNIF